MTNFDGAITKLIQRLPSWVRPLMLVVTTVGSPLTVGPLLFSSVLVFAAADSLLVKPAAILLVLLPLVMLIKVLARRLRPDTAYVAHMWFKTPSFPSGHAYGSLLAYGFLAYGAVYAWPDVRGSGCVAALTALIVLIGVSRVYLGAHFPSDVVGGWVLGGTVLAVVLIISSL